jgi:hypothetical protein
MITGVGNANNGTPSKYSLDQNFPNPFNPTTTISFTIAFRTFVSLKIFNVLGEEVSTIVSEELPAGCYSREWHADHFSSGIYFCRIQADHYDATRKLVLLK